VIKGKLPKVGQKKSIYNSCWISRHEPFSFDQNLSKKMLSFDNADVRVAVKNKVPLVRSSTLTWVAFCIETSNKATVLKLHKEYVPICMEVNNHFILLATSLFLVLFCIWADLFFQYVVLEWWYSRSTRCIFFCFNCHSQGFLLENLIFSSLHYMYQNVALKPGFIVTFALYRWLVWNHWSDPWRN
jgi:hypothetical protein